MSTAPVTPVSRTLSARLGFPEAVVELGHTHPSVRRVMAGVGGTLSFLVTLDDDRIEGLEIEIGLGHRGFEKEVESRPWHEALPYVARLGHASGPIAQVGYCLALERMAGQAVPERATWLRTLVCELARITDHLARIAALSTAIGASAAERAAQQGELVAMQLLVAAVGGGPLESWAHPGGVACDLPANFAELWTRSCRELEGMLDRFGVLLLDHPTAAQRLVGVAPLGSDACLALGVTGPCLRASGIAFDQRRDSPYLAYGELDFDVPIGEQGDDYDRLAVVVEEIRQGLRMVEQCIRRLAALERNPGDLASSAPGELVVPAGEVTFSIESSTGELVFFLASDGVGLPRRMRCRAPSFFHARALSAALSRAHLDDLLPTAALFHLVSGECDR